MSRYHRHHASSPGMAWLFDAFDKFITLDWTQVGNQSECRSDLSSPGWARIPLQRKHNWFVWAVHRRILLSYYGFLLEGRKQVSSLFDELDGYSSKKVSLNPIYTVHPGKLTKYVVPIRAGKERVTEWHVIVRMLVLLLQPPLMALGEEDTN